MHQFGLRALVWPLKKKEVQDIIEKLEKWQDMLAFALKLDQANLALDTSEKLNLRNYRWCMVLFLDHMTANPMYNASLEPGKSCLERFRVDSGCEWNPSPLDLWHDR